MSLANRKVRGGGKQSVSRMQLDFGAGAASSSSAAGSKNESEMHHALKERQYYVGGHGEVYQHFFNKDDKLVLAPKKTPGAGEKIVNSSEDIEKLVRLKLLIKMVGQ